MFKTYSKTNEQNCFITPGSWCGLNFTIANNFAMSYRNECSFIQHRQWVTKNYCLFTLITVIITSVSLCTLMHTHWRTWTTCFTHFLPLTLWLYHKLTEVGNISWSFSKADNELLVSLLGFHCIRVSLIEINKILHVAQMSQCCLITNFPIKIKLGHVLWNIKIGREEILPSV